MKKIVIFLAAWFVYGYMSAQVTIGTLEKPNEGALLDLKENDKVGLDKPNSTKGLLFPKVELVSSTSLKPLLDDTDEQKRISSLGMIVYNVNDNASGLKTGLCVWNGEEWTSIEGGGSSGTANFEVDCETPVTIKGSLVKGKSLNPLNNTVLLPVNVWKKGKYTILASTNNGYYFSSAGEFFEPGRYDVVLTGIGSPNNTTDQNRLDTLAFYINGILTDLDTCIGIQTLVVEGIAPDYFIIQPVDASGANLRVNEAGTGYMTVRIRATPEAAGAYYHIETDTQDGIKFEGSGVLVPGTQIATLVCNGGTPTKMGILTFHITSNSVDPRNTNILTDVFVGGRAINVTILSHANNEWSLVPADRVVSLLNNKTLFGPNSNYCPIDSIYITHTNDASYEPAANTDIVILSYNINITSNSVQALTEFINKGGAVIHCYHPYSNNNNNDNPFKLINNILGSGITRTNIEDYTVKLTGIPGDSIVKNGGYLSNLSGRKLGCDGRDNSYFNNVDPTTTDILATTITTNNPTILKSKTKTYLVIGDGGPFCGGKKSFAERSDNFRPLMVTSNGFPTPKNYGQHRDVYNAHFFVNAMIWAINRRLAIEP